MPVQKITPRSLNLDDDFLVVKSTEMVDAFNIEIASDDNGNANVVKSIQGNTAISFAGGSALPGGTNTVIGSSLNTEKNEIVFAVWNSGNNHSIYLYSTTTNVCTLVYRDAILGFTQDAFVKFDFIVLQNGNTIAYFTDGVSEPKKINITKAIGASGYPYKTAGGYSYGDEEKLLSIAALRQPPIEPPVASFARVGSEDGFVYDEYFQFAYQYIYEDGEISAISPYTELSLNTYQLLEDYIGYESKTYYNTINVTVKPSRGDVSKIRLLARSSESLSFFVVGEISNDRSAGSAVVAFTNSKLRAYVADSEQNKMYDNVPKKANTQAITSNRLMYGGYTEFYDNVSPNVSISEIDSNVGINVPISVNPTTGQSVQYAPAVPAITSKFNIVVGDTMNLMQDQSEVLLDFSVSGGASITFGSSAVVQLTPTESTYDLLLGKVEFEVIKRFTIPAYTSLTSPSPSIYTYFINNIVGNYEVAIGDAEADLITSGDNHSFKGTAVINVSFDAVNYGTTQVSFIVKIVSVTLETYEGRDGTTGEPIPRADFISFSLNTNLLNTSYVTTYGGFRAFRNYNSRQYAVTSSRSFKSGQRHKFGIVYYDLFNRSGAVNEIGEKEVSFISNRQGAANGPVALQFKLQHTPPSWAKKWQLVYSPFSSYKYSIQHSVSEAFSNTTDSFIYVSMNTLEGKVYSYKDSKEAKLDYSFVEGDKLKIVSYDDGAGRTFVEYEFDILAYEYYDANNTPIPAVINPDRKTGWFLKLRDNVDATNFAKSFVAASLDSWNNKAVVEIYRPARDNDSVIYREISEVYDVVFSGGSYKHKGDRDFSYTWTSGSSNITVLNGIATTTLDIKTGDLITISHTVLGLPESFEVRVGTISTFGSDKTFSVTNANVVGQFGVSIPSNDNYSLASITGLSNAIVQTSNGDVYYRPRKMIFIVGYPGSGNLTTTTNDIFVEDNSISDFRVSNVSVFGRPNATVPTAFSVYRKASITYSDPYVIDSSVLTLSSFNLSLANFNDYANKYGGIKYIHSNDDSIFVLQERKASIIPVGRNLVEYADGSANLTISNNFLGVQNFYAGEYGVNDNPESVVERTGRLYFCDIISGKILRLGGDGITPISDYGIGSFIANKFNEIISSASSHRIIGVYDPDKDYYIFSTSTISGSGVSLTMTFDVNENTWISKHSWNPESGLALNDSLITFKSGVMYKHSGAASYGIVYGVSCPPSLSVIANENPSQVKVFKSISQESNKPFSFAVDNSNQTSMTVPSTDFTNVSTAILDEAGNAIGLGFQQTREGIYYAEIPRDITNTTQAMVVIGTAESVGADTITFSSGVSNIPFEFGKPVDRLTGGAFVSQGYNVTDIVNYNTIRVSAGPAGAIVGSVIAVRSENAVNGDSMRDRYARIAFSGSTGAFELYAVNVNYAESKLHFA